MPEVRGSCVNLDQIYAMKIPTASPESLKRGRPLMVLLFISSSLVLFFSELVEKSMFIDGVWYAVISRNLAEGVEKHKQARSVVRSSLEARAAAIAAAAWS